MGGAGRVVGAGGGTPSLSKNCQAQLLFWGGHLFRKALIGSPRDSIIMQLSNQRNQCRPVQSNTAKMIGCRLLASHKESRFSFSEKERIKNLICLSSEDVKFL